MNIHITLARADALHAYAMIPIAYRVTEELDLDRPAAPGDPLPFASRVLESSVIKDYDAEPGNHPLDWVARFDVREWGILVATHGEEPVGGAVIVTQSPDVEMLEGRDDLAVLWDIRVAPAMRHRGVGSALLAAGESWARARGARMLEVETQHTNVPACRFYSRHGFVLRAVHRGAYPTLPNEVQLLWRKELVRRETDEQRPT